MQINLNLRKRNTYVQYFVVPLGPFLRVHFHWLQLTEEYFNPDEAGPAAPYLEPGGAYSNLKPKDEEYDQLGLITERNLVDFARQIAAGMVSLAPFSTVADLGL